MVSKKRHLKFIFLLILELADFINDWLLFAEFNVIEKGLVYGPPNKAAVQALLTFAILGTATFLVEMLNLWRETYRENAWLNTTLVSAIVLWIEDVPQMCINVYIVYCREDPSSILQIVKGSIALLDAAIHGGMALYEYRKNWEEIKYKKCCSLLKVCWGFIMAGMLITTAGAIVIFIFAHGHSDEQGKVIIRTPGSLVKDDYNEQKYFQNVSVFLPLPGVAAATATKLPWSETDWIRVMSINDVRDADNPDSSFRIVHDLNNNQFRMAVYKETNSQKGTWQLSGCYQMDLATRITVSVNESTCGGAGFFSGSSSNLFLTFHFTSPDDSILFRERILGDIGYNVKNGTCLHEPKPPPIRYYRVNATISTSTDNHLLFAKGGSLGFYRSGSGHHQLQSARAIWKTGWGACDCSGNTQPILDRDIDVTCSN